MPSRQDHNSGVDNISRAEEVCRAASATLTPVRRRVYEILCAIGRPVGAYDVLRAYSEGQKKTAPPTVYRALDFLIEVGLVHKIESLNAFVACAAPHPKSASAHVLFVCSDCGTTSEIENSAALAALQAETSQKGLRIDHVTIEAFGHCNKCGSAAP